MMAEEFRVFVAGAPQSRCGEGGSKSDRSNKRPSTATNRDYGSVRQPIILFGMLQLRGRPRVYVGPHSHGRWHDEPFVPRVGQVDPRLHCQEYWISEIERIFCAPNLFEHLP
ncbi:hypothetical protein J6590_075306 [Homalodisca vitripennis]|nr:hypothetical protein J6590_102084 [Homalodisca vitripennis]KAG8325150.1 hypothetical protein J6590_075306 [Homalodisca vitripennis]